MYRSASALENIRDLFIVLSYTAVRSSDIKNICSENIQVVEGVKICVFKQTKTGGSVAIPLHPYVTEILDKHHGILPVSIQQLTNRLIKVVAYRAGITENVNITKHRGLGRTVVTLPKYELITTHTGRRSAATNMFLAGIPSAQIMSITGHSSEKQ